MATYRGKGYSRSCQIKPLTSIHTMSVVVHQYETRNNPAFHQMMHVNKQYCQRQGYIYNNVTTNYDLTPYWVKIVLLRKTLQRPNVAYVAWFDSDSAVYDMDRKIESFFTGNTEFVISYDAHSYPDAKIANAGVFFIKNTPSMRKLMDEWWATYNPTRWIRKNGNWECMGPWEGPDYEQGTFNSIIMPKYSTIRCLHPSVLCCHNIIPPAGTFASHFNGLSNKQYTIYPYLLARRMPELLLLLAVGTGVAWYIKNRKLH